MQQSSENLIRTPAHKQTKASQRCKRTSKSSVNNHQGPSNDKRVIADIKDIKKEMIYLGETAVGIVVIDDAQSQQEGTKTLHQHFLLVVLIRRNL